MKVTQRLCNGNFVVYCNVKDLNKREHHEIIQGTGVSNLTSHSERVWFSLHAAAGPIEIEE